MVSKARDDLPEPERPVMTVRLLRGISRLMFFRLCWRAPRTTSLVKLIKPDCSLQGVPAHSGHSAARIIFHDNNAADCGQAGVIGSRRSAGRKRNPYCKKRRLGSRKTGELYGCTRGACGEE